MIASPFLVPEEQSPCVKSKTTYAVARLSVAGLVLAATVSCSSGSCESLWFEFTITDDNGDVVDASDLALDEQGDSEPAYGAGCVTRIKGVCQSWQAILRTKTAGTATIDMTFDLSGDRRSCTMTVAVADDGICLNPSVSSPCVLPST